MKSTHLRLSILFFPLLAFAQPNSLWSRTYLPGATTNCYSMEHTPDNGYVLAGHSVQDGVFLLKTNANGDSLWSRHYMRFTNAHTFSVHRTFDGGYAVAGYALVSSHDSTAYFLLKTDSFGDSLWCKTYRTTNFSNACYASVQTADSGFALIGTVGSRIWTPDFGHVWLVKTNALGDSLWSRTYLVSGSQSQYDAECRLIQQMPDGGYVLGLNHSHWGSGILRLNEFGDSLTSRWYFRDGTLSFSMTPTRDGGYFLAGRYGDWYGPGWRWIRTDANFDSLWSGVLLQSSDAATSEAHAAVETADGGFVVAGCDSGQFCLIRLNRLGTPLWTCHYGQNYCAAWAMQPTPQGGFALAGYVYHGGDSERYPQLVVTGPDPYQSYTEPSPAIQKQYYLFTNYPNPFNPETRISFDLPHAAPTQLQIFDVSGRAVSTLINGMTASGHHDISFNARALPSGVYFYHLQSGGFSATRKMFLLK